MMRRRGPGLIRTAARTAVIAGTATAVSGKVARNQQQKAMRQAAAQQAEAGPPPAAGPQAAAPPGGGDDLVAKLQQLADLKASGVLNEEEFAAAKAKLL